MRGVSLKSQFAKIHSPLTAELHLLTQMQSCPAGGVATCKGMGREESFSPPCVTCISKANSKSLGGVPAGHSKGWAVMEGIIPLLFLSCFTRMLTLCHNRFGLLWIKFVTQAACFNWTSKDPGKYFIWLQGLQNQVIWEHLWNSSWCHSRGWRYQTHLVPFFCFIFTLYPTGVIREAWAGNDHVDKHVPFVSLTFIICSKRLLILQVFAQKSLYPSLIILRSLTQTQNQTTKGLWVFQLLNIPCRVLDSKISLYIFKC